MPPAIAISASSRSRRCAEVPLGAIRWRPCGGLCERRDCEFGPGSSWAKQAFRHQVPEERRCEIASFGYRSARILGQAHGASRARIRGLPKMPQQTALLPNFLSAQRRRQLPSPIAGLPEHGPGRWRPCAPADVLPAIHRSDHTATDRALDGQGPCRESCALAWPRKNAVSIRSTPSSADRHPIASAARR